MKAIHNPQDALDEVLKMKYEKRMTNFGWKAQPESQLTFIEIDRDLRVYWRE
ncbi:MAG: hypothetical protein P8J32_01585 [bacterium]|nr:hypothetical protein [bacterium]